MKTTFSCHASRLHADTVFQPLGSRQRGSGRAGPHRPLALSLMLLLVSGCVPEDQVEGERFQGTVSLTQGEVASTEQTSLGGWIADANDIRLEGLPGCSVVRSVGSCVQLSCPSIDPALDGGTLTASVEGVEVATSAHSPGGYLAFVEGRAFNPGDRISLTTAGGVVPMFTADVIAPERLVTSLPTTYRPGADLTIRWSSVVAADEVEVGLVGGGTSVVCAAPAGEGELAVGAAITADLAGPVSISVKSLNITAVTAGRFRVAAIAAEAVSGAITAE